jgi:hypothetical protein
MLLQILSYRTILRKRTSKERTTNSQPIRLHYDSILQRLHSTDALRGRTPESRYVTSLSFSLTGNHICGNSSHTTVRHIFSTEKIRRGGCTEQQRLGILEARRNDAEGPVRQNTITTGAGPDVAIKTSPVLISRLGSSALSAVPGLWPRPCNEALLKNGEEHSFLC